MLICSLYGDPVSFALPEFATDFELLQFRSMSEHTKKINQIFPCELRIDSAGELIRINLSFINPNIICLFFQTLNEFAFCVNMITSDYKKAACKFWKDQVIRFRTFDFINKTKSGD